MGEEAHVARRFTEQHQQVGVFGQVCLRLLEAVFIGQPRLAENPALLLAFVDIGHPETGFEQCPAPQRCWQSPVIVALRLAELVDAVAPDFVGEFVADQRIVGFIVSRGDQHLIGREFEVVLGCLVEDFAVVIGDPLAPRRGQPVPAGIDHHHRRL